MTMRLRPLLPCLLALLALPAAARADAACGPAAAGPCHVWTGHVTGVNDGDTVFVDLDGDGSRRSATIRFIGVQAMELRRYNNSDPSRRRGDCHAMQANDLVERLVRRAHGRVRLSSRLPKVDGRGRLFRSVAARLGGRWVDLGRRLMGAGATIWTHGADGLGWNATYNRLGQLAALRGRGLWSRAGCRPGPAQDVPLKLWVMSDPAGEESLDPNQEWIAIANLDPARAVSLGGWWVRDSGLRRFRFPAGTRIGPRQTITVHVGAGADTAGTFHWGLPATIFANSISGGDAGDGAYLFDPQGDLRAWMVYPCVVACTDPLQGALRVSAHPSRQEWVDVRNVSAASVDLHGYELRLPGGYAFPAGTVLSPGESVRVEVQGDPASDTRTVRHIGIDGPYMPDRGGAARVSTFDEITLACDSWGTGRC
jgi:endonuclease YncB( thermonuclease family)